MKKVYLDPVLASVIGLDPKAARVYASLLDSSPASIASIATSAHLHRPDVYAVLPRLKVLGLVVSAPSGRRTVFSAGPLEVLRKLAIKRLSGLPKRIADLEKSREPKQERLEGVRLFRGRAGLKTILNDLTTSMRRGETFYRISSRRADTDVEQYIPRTYRTERDRKKLEQFVITNAGRLYKKRLESLSRTVPIEGGPFDYNVAQLIYGDKVVTIDYEKAEAVAVHSPRIARFQEHLFRLLFRRL